MAEKATIARPYAKAAFASAQEHGAFERWSAVLATAAAVVQDPQVASLLDNPRVQPGQLSGLIADLAGQALDERSRNFLDLLAANRRLDLAPEIAGMFEVLRAQAENLADVEVVSAIELSDAQRERLSAALARRLGRQIRLHCSVDAALIGGAIVRSGDFVIDGSLRARLDRLAQQMTH